jgi:hypothetical protein
VPNQSPEKPLARNPIHDVLFGLEELIRESVKLDRTIDELSLREPSEVRDAMLLTLRLRRADLIDKIKDRNAMDGAKRAR